MIATRSTKVCYRDYSITLRKQSYSRVTRKNEQEQERLIATLLNVWPPPSTKSCSDMIGPYEGYRTYGSSCVTKDFTTRLCHVHSTSIPTKAIPNISAHRTKHRLEIRISLLRFLARGGTYLHRSPSCRSYRNRLILQISSNPHTVGFKRSVVWRPDPHCYKRDEESTDSILRGTGSTSCAKNWRATMHHCS